VFPVPRWTTDAKGNAHQVSDEPTGKISNHAWNKARARAGVPWLRFHDLRHTWASWHVQQGTPLPVLQELGGWASLAMVQRYAHLGQSHIAVWAGNVSPGGTKVAHPAPEEGKKKGPEGPSTEVGWLMGLEPTTTRITTGSLPSEPSKIKHLPVRKKPKAA
jgi:hypothetical protein